MPRLLPQLLTGRLVLLMNRSKSIFRVNKTENFVSISRFTLEDSRMSWEARGLYAFLLAKPDDWETCIQHLINSSPAGRDKTKRVVKELIGFNYIVKVEQRSQLGRFSRPLYHVYESPVDGYFDRSISPEAENPSPENPLPFKPSTEDRTQLNKQSNKDKQNTKKTTTTTNDLVWPRSLVPSQQASILTLANKVEPVVVQLLLDELAGQIDNIKNPVGYFRSLLLSHQSDTFIPAKALSVQTSREIRKRNAVALDHAHKQSEERFKQMVQQLQNSDG